MKYAPEIITVFVFSKSERQTKAKIPSSQFIINIKMR